MFRALVKPPSVAGRRVGLYGGSFNPVHDGHVRVARTALTRLGLDEIWWLVSPQNPLKSSAETQDYGLRLGAVRALAHNPRMIVTDIEARLATPYTAETLAALKALAPQTRFVWIMGGDNLASFHLWRGWREIMETTPIAAIARAGVSGRGHLSAAALAPAPAMYARARVGLQGARQLVEMRPPCWLYLPMRLHPASSTEIRARIARR